MAGITIFRHKVIAFLVIIYQRHLKTIQALVDIWYGLEAKPKYCIVWGLLPNCIYGLESFYQI